MTVYRVIVHVTESFGVEVDADSEAEASAKALDVATEDDGYHLSDCFLAVMDRKIHYVYPVRESKPGEEVDVE